MALKRTIADDIIHKQFRILNKFLCVVTAARSRLFFFHAGRFVEDPFERNCRALNIQRQAQKCEQYFISHKLCMQPFPSNAPQLLTSTFEKNTRKCLASNTDVDNAVMKKKNTCKIVRLRVSIYIPE